MEERDLTVTAGSESALLDPGAAGLTEEETAVRRAAFQSISKRPPAGASTLALATGLDAEPVESAVASLVRKGQTVVDPAGRVVGSAGLSLVPARHRLRLGQEEVHTWCAIDAVGIPTALGVDAVAGTDCPTCGRSIEIDFWEGRAADDGELRAWLPRQDLLHERGRRARPDMNLFCTEEHLEGWRRRTGDPSGVVLTLKETEELGRTWWSDLA